MSKSLKLRRLERRFLTEHRKTMTENLTFKGKIIVEAINKELLKRYSSAVNTAERLNTLLGIAQMEKLRKISMEFSENLQYELEKATKFSKTGGIPGTNKVMNYLRSWLGKYYKGGTLKKMATFVKEFKQGIDRAREYIDASLPEKFDRTDENISVGEIIRLSSTTLQIHHLKTLIINAFEFSKNEWNDAIDQTAEAILNIPFNELGDFNDEIQKIDSNIAATVDIVDQATEEVGITGGEGKETPENGPAVTTTNKPEDLAKALAKLDSNQVSWIVRSANRQRRRMS